jgi:Leucine-rich repeat (LRR) protein
MCFERGGSQVRHIIVLFNGLHKLALHCHKYNMHVVLGISHMLCSLFFGLVECSGVAHLTNLLELDLGERRFEADAELQQLSVVTALRTLQLRKCYFMDGGAQQVAGLSSLPRLSSLDMSYWCSVGDPVISIVSGLSSLTHLNISRTRVSDAGMSKLLRLPRLSILDASYCLDLRGHGLTRLENSTSLTMLNLSECKKLPDIRVRFSMRHSPQLQVMDVNSLRDEFMAKATSYGPTPGLTAVSLRGCHKVSRQTLQRYAWITFLLVK